MLTNQTRLSRRTVAVILSLVMLNVYVLMGARTSRASTGNTAEETSSEKLLVGRLSLADQQRIFVNGNEAQTGTTIFSGMRLQSPVGVSATVQLGALGQINLEPGTDLSLNFSKGHVDVTVASGTATLTTGEGVEGILTDANGNVTKSNGTTASVLSTNPSAAKMSGKRKALWWILGITAVVVIVVVAVAVSDDDNSPS